MADESVYVAIAIACVMALLMLGIFVIYCVKRHQDKAMERQVRERRAREERQRRQFMRGQIVRPPPYEANCLPQYSDLSGHRDIPYSPPPAYKEAPTPLPGQGRSQGVGIGGITNPGYDYPPEHEEIPSVTRNVAPANTHFAMSSNHYLQQHSSSNNTTTTTTTNNNNNNNHHNLGRSISQRSPRRTNSVAPSDASIRVHVTPREAPFQSANLPDVVTSTTQNHTNTALGSPATNHSTRVNNQNSSSHASHINDPPQYYVSTSASQHSSNARSNANIYRSPSRQQPGTASSRNCTPGLNNATITRLSTSDSRSNQSAVQSTLQDLSMI